VRSPLRSQAGARLVSQSPGALAYFRAAAGDGRRLRLIQSRVCRLSNTALEKIDGAIRSLPPLTRYAAGGRRRGLRWPRGRWLRWSRLQHGGNAFQVMAAPAGSFAGSSCPRHCRFVWHRKWQTGNLPALAVEAIGAPWLATCARFGEIDLRQVDRHPDASISSLFQELSCRSCRPNPPFAILVQLKGRSAASNRREGQSRPKRSR
jgi:hypothetical protein